MRHVLTSPWVALLLGITQCTGLRRVEQVQVVTTDLDHFWAAYPAAQRDTAQAATTFEQQYFARASPGLREYYARKYEGKGGAALFARRISQRPRFYASVQATTQAVTAQKPRILAALRRLQELYPATHFNNIYFLIGGFAGSTAQPPGLLIGVDQVANGPGVDTSELTLVQRNRCGTLDNLPNLLIHELVHNLQQRADGTLLSAAIREGMADFVAERVTGTLGTNGRLHVYGKAHERELWAAFQLEMRSSATHNWLANPGQETPEKPCDLGYYVGYRICQAYYAQAPDQEQALASMLTTKDFGAFLRQSGYAQQVNSTSSSR